jgi:tetratricopeptide (TPR) repeat protein
MFAATLVAKPTRILFCILFATQLLIGTVAVAQEPPNWDGCIGRNNPTFEQRIRACTAIIETDGISPADKAKALGNRGVAYANTHDLNGAIRDYEESLRLDDTSASSHRFRGNKYLIEKNFSAALAEYNEALRLDPTNVFALANRGRLYADRKDYEHALADLNEAIRLDPDWSLAYYHRGMTYYAQKDYDRALADLDQAIQRNSSSASAFIARGMVRHAKGEFSQAISEYDQAILIDKSAVAYLNRGLTRRAMRDFEAAIADFGEAIRLNPKYGTAYLNRGLTHSAKNDYPQAIADYDQAIQIDPALAVAYGYRCGDRIAAGQDLHAALSDCNESLRLQPSQTTASTHRGFIYLRLGDVNRAGADFEAALSIDPKNAWSLYGRGLAKWDKGDTSGGQADVTVARKARSNLTLAVAKYYGLSPQRSLLSRLDLASVKERPMVFAIAVGINPDSCGVGCNEWIVADGFFDKGADKRFLNFLDGLRGRKLPIFFNSNGGFVSEALAIGRMMRERKMTAGVGTTVPENCRGVVDESCRRMLQTSDPLKAQLRTARAFCHSACVYAFIGASSRQVAEGAVLGIHAHLQLDSGAQSRRDAEASEERSRANRRQYIRQMGVDPELVELADKTPHIDIHLLTRDEIARLQIETTRH